MLQAGILKPVHQAKHWIHSFVLVEGMDKLGNLKVRICLDAPNLNKAIVCEPYHFKTREDIAHLLQMHVLLQSVIVEKGFGINSFMELHPS